MGTAKHIRITYERKKLLPVPSDTYRRTLEARLRELYPNAEIAIISGNATSFTMDGRPSNELVAISKDVHRKIIQTLENWLSPGDGS